MWITQLRLISYVKNCTPERQFGRSRSCVVRLIQFSNGSCLVYYLSISPAFSLVSLQYSIWISIQSLSCSGTMGTAIVPGHCGEEAKWAQEGQQMGTRCKLHKETVFALGQMMDGSSSFHRVKILCIPACSLCALVFAARISTVVIIWQNCAVAFALIHLVHLILSTLHLESFAPWYMIR